MSVSVTSSNVCRFDRGLVTELFRKVFEQELTDSDIVLEDGGEAAIITIQQEQGDTAVSDEDCLFVRIQSYYKRKSPDYVRTVHPEVEQMRGQRVRVTIEVVPPEPDRFPGCLKVYRNSQNCPTGAEGTFYPCDMCHEKYDEVVPVDDSVVAQVNRQLAGELNDLEDHLHKLFVRLEPVLQVQEQGELVPTAPDQLNHTPLGSELHETLLRLHRLDTYVLSITESVKL